jgi:hypothetical protein
VIHGRACKDEPCPFCESLAEDRAYSWGFDDDADKAADQYDRYLDRLGPAS